MYFDGIGLPKLILGCDPFECYTPFYPNPKEKQETYIKRFSNVQTIVDLVSSAAGKGINALNLIQNKNLIDAAVRIRKSRLEVKFVPLIYRIPVKINDEPVPIVRTEASVFHRFFPSLENQPLYEELIQSSAVRRAERAMKLSKQEIQNMRLDEKKIEEALGWFHDIGSVRLVMTCVDFFCNR